MIHRDIAKIITIVFTMGLVFFILSSALTTYLIVDYCLHKNSLILRQLEPLTLYRTRSSHREQEI